MQKLSIVTICFNSGDLIASTIESVLKQTYSDFEYIIIDGASNDNTLAIVESFRDRFLSKGIEFRLYSEKDTGIYNAMNKGIKKANGEWINFMNAGDMFFNNEVLEKVFREDYDGYDIITGSAIRQFKNHADTWYPKPISEMWRLMPFCHQSTFVRLAYHKQRLFDERFRLGGDYDFFFDSYFYQKKRFYYLKVHVCIYDMQGQSTSNPINDAKENLKLAWKYYAPKSTVFFGLRLYKLLIKRILLSSRTSVPVVKEG